MTTVDALLCRGFLELASPVTNDVSDQRWHFGQNQQVAKVGLPKGPTRRDLYGLRKIISAACTLGSTPCSGKDAQNNHGFTPPKSIRQSANSDEKNRPPSDREPNADNCVTSRQTRRSLLD